MQRRKPNAAITLRRRQRCCSVRSPTVRRHDCTLRGRQTGIGSKPLRGIGAAVVDESGAEHDAPGSGLLVLTEPGPSMLRGIWGDDERFRETYWSRFSTQGYYFAGDGARVDADGDLWLLGRVDDVTNVSG